MPTTTSVRGRFLWYEAMSTDPEATKAFYTAVIGWKVQNWEGMGEPYPMFVQGESMIGGVMKLPDEAAAQGAPSHWLCYIGVENVDAALEQIEQLGGRKHAGPMDIPTVGRIAICADPQGATFAIFTPESEMPEAPPSVGHFSWHELASTDRAAGYEFYRALFGWEEIDRHDMGPMGIYQIYGRQKEGPPLGGMCTKPDSMPGPSAWQPYILVEDVDAAVARVTAAGGKVVNGPMEVPGGDKILHGIDPTGAMFALHSLAKK